MPTADEVAKQAMDAAIWVTASPHEWVWTHEQQVAMARYCIQASHSLSLWTWLGDMRCTVVECAVAPGDPPKWVVFDVDGFPVALGKSPENAIENARNSVEPSEIGPAIPQPGAASKRERELEAILDTLKSLPWDYERPWTTSDANTLRRAVGRPELKFHSNWKFMPADDEGNMKFERLTPTDDHAKGG